MKSSLAIGENSFHIDSHVSARTVGTADDTETKSFVPRTLEKSSGQYRKRCTAFTWSWQSTKTRLLSFGGFVDVFKLRISIQTFIRVLSTLKLYCIYLNRKKMYVIK
ncbi:hypothetical protein ALC53_07063 [Atta colombica]|uniref:Uncharacterized protein n=1 Tax=Atta colombica TaxID=520822 RepID=A0A195BEF3_9HYME|nr:hypothetical protein ALC53_07063 [Atta colombica]